MCIQGTPAGTPARDTDATGVSGAGEPAPPVRRTDAVQISTAGRARAEAELPARQDPASRLTSDQIARVREWIDSGEYNSLDVIDAVARRILASGDLGPGSDAS